MKWQERKAAPLASDLVEEFQLNPLTAKLFSLRGNDTAEKIDFWLNASEADLADPFLMHDMDKAVDRINQALDRGEKITIYGDYDADGITATAIMTEMLAIMGADVHYFIPDRFKDGYGPSLERYKQIVADGTNLIITVDNGVTGIEEVAYAQAHGVDVIVTDHHTFKEEKPAAYALVHCNYPGQAYPFDDYCGAGVAYTIARAVLEDTASEFLELAMIGTIGDMVKVSGEGHIIVKRGLELLNESSRPGLQALIRNAGLTPGMIDEEDVGFSIAPRLNACGRLADASLAVRLLLAESPGEAQELADQIEELNNRRKELTQETMQAAEAQIKARGYQKAPTLTLYDPDWHEGVMGLVANKVVEKNHKPTLMLTKNESGIVKGSGRSSQGFNLFNALKPFEGQSITQFGGHDFACGLSTTEDKLPQLREDFNQSFAQGEQAAEKVQEFDGTISPLDVDLTSAADLALAGPFGTDNPQPVFEIAKPQISNFRPMRKGCSFMVGQVRAVDFDHALNQTILPYLQQMLVKIARNTFKGKTNVQFRVVDLKYGQPLYAPAARIVDFREQEELLGFADKYLLFNEKNLPQAMSHFGLTSQQVSLAKDNEDLSQQIVSVLDVPANEAQLNFVLSKKYRQLYLRFQLDQLPGDSLPSRGNFGLVWQYFLAHPGLKPNDYMKASGQLGINPDSIMFILRVFFTLDFVKMEEDRLLPQPSLTKKSLDDSAYYRSVKAEYAFVNKLRTISSNELIRYANGLANGGLKNVN
ncbi:single-stranded-DNA-specific exonuclease [Lactobacillus nasalidis]|uniref:Single-stranded-DNA-specific exonuclease RecJ n=1 Tax=Lactobacillus nasalidis TaxID=2797258 RepID=A0ABQ3W3A2_9LACO|nr:single-stranded-DNA-specific exonuclease RecJ [Lactobacillus nasalidis]GHW00716.1 single-stranded-DNA-specific exonuclease [Lactobacillus nasalidis]